MKKLKEIFNLEKLKELRSNKKGRAKLELCLYLIFFVFVIIFTQVSSHKISKIDNKTNDNNVVEATGFINSISDNYECNINITIDDNNYLYSIKELGNNTSIKRTVSDSEESFYRKSDKYYKLDENGNYILTDIKEIYNNLDYFYLNLSNIKNFISYSTKEDNKYLIKVSDIILNSTKEENISIIINEEENSISVDYSNLFDNYNKVLVDFKYSNINMITSLDE